VVAFERQLLCFPCLTGQYILQAHEVLLRVRARVNAKVINCDGIWLQILT
jgi:hypothetical protein